MNIKKWLPAADWIQNYNKKTFKSDLNAGLTIGIMLIPQGMGLAMIAGLPAIYGLYAATIPLIIYALFGTSRQLSVGPVAMISLLTAAGIGAIANGDAETYILLAITLALFVGVLQLLLGVFRLGFLVNFLSHPVLNGFTSAAAIIIGLSQLKHLFGLDISKTRYFYEVISKIISQFEYINWITFAIGIGGILVMKGIKKWVKIIPAQLAVVVLGILVVWAGDLTQHGVEIVGEIPKGLPQFAVPSVDVSNFQALLPIGLTIALVGFTQSIAIAKAIQAKHKNYTIRPNQELIALGLANIGGSFFQSYPTTGGFARTAVSDQAGAKTGLTSIISASFVILTLLFLTDLFYYLPNAVLASIIMMAVLNLIDFKAALHLWKSDRSDFWMLLTTFVATLGLGIEEGIGIGVILSLAMVIFRSVKPHTAVLGQVPNTRLYRNINRFEEVQERAELLIIRFDAQLYFANVNFFKEKMAEEIARKGDALQHIIIVADSINSIDSSAIQAIEDLVSDCQTKGIALHFSGVIGPVRDVLAKSDLIQKIGVNHFHLSVQGAVNAIDDWSAFTSEELDTKEKYTLQVNK